MSGASHCKVGSVCKARHGLARLEWATALAVVALGFVSACNNSCPAPPPTCGQPPVGLVEIQVGDDIPAPATKGAVSCQAPSPADTPFCDAASEYIGREYDPVSKAIGPALAGPGRLNVEAVDTHCKDSCSGKTGGGLHLKIPLESCSISVGGDLSSKVSSAHGSELDQHVSLSVPTADASAQWDLTTEQTNLRAFCTDPSANAGQVIVEFWTGKVDVQAMTSVDQSADADLCCEGSAVCLKGSVNLSGSAESSWDFQGTVGVKVVSRETFCLGARLWLDNRCSTGTPAPSLCGDPWWDKID